jgi:CheY-like chemotaxis protein
MGLDRTGGYDVSVENTGTRALATSRTLSPDLIVLDFCMPDTDGGEIAAQIRADPRLKNTPIVFLTSIVSHAEAGAKSLASGGSIFMAKPVNLPRMIQCMESLLGHAG